MYFETLFYGLDFSVTEETFKIRKELKSFYEKYGEDALYEKLLAADPESAKNVHKHNVKGVIRALEIFSTGGKKKSDAVGKKRLSRKGFQAIYP